MTLINNPFIGLKWININTQKVDCGSCSCTLLLQSSLDTIEYMLHRVKQATLDPNAVLIFYSF